MWQGRGGLPPAGRCKSPCVPEEGFCSRETPRGTTPPPAPELLNGVPVPLQQKQALIGFRKAEEMRPVTSRDKDLRTKEETCSEAVFSFTWGYFWAKKRQHRIVVGGRELGLGGKEPCPEGQARFSWQMGTVVGTMFPHLPTCFRGPPCSQQLAAA